MKIFRPVVASSMAVLSLAILQNAFAQSRSEVGNMHVPDAVGRSVMLGHTDPNRQLHIAMSLPYGDPEGMQNFVDSVSDPSSRNYHQFITPEEVGARFGLPLGQVQAVASYLKSNGMNVTLIAKNRLNVLADATVAQAEKAFGVTINEYQGNGHEAGNNRFFSFSQTPKLPSELAASVIDISGLENFTKPLMRQVLNPNQTRVLYNTSPIYSAGRQGQGRTIAISSWDGYRLSNVPLYYSQYGLPTPPGGVGSNITVITISGGAGGGNPGAEGDLDIQMVLGQAPLCNFRIYDGGGSDLIGVLTAEANDNASDVISESYGWNITASTATSAHNLHLSMSAQGITYMAASGDNGTSLEPYSYPDYDPEVLMVGGTVATTDSTGNRTSEVGWSGSGSGFSTNTASFNTLPSWQQGTGVPTNVNHRLVPDVALHASGGSTGAYYFYLNGSLTSGYIGTSFASPVFAGSLGVTEQQIIAGGGLPPNGAGKQRFGRIQDLFYSQNGRSDVWFDITSGSSGNLPNPPGGTATAGPGWDYVTGWGAINFNAFASTQVSAGPPPAPTNLTASAGNGSVSLSWNSSSGATSYNVKRSTTSGSEVTVATSSTNSYTDNGLTNGTTYFYVVSAVNGSGESGNSNEASATPTAPAPDFSMSTGPSPQSVLQGNAVSYTTNITALNGFGGTVSFTASGLPTGATIAFNPTTVTGTGATTDTIMTAVSTPTGTYTVTITGTSGSLTHSNNVTLIVSPPGDFSLSASPSAISIRRGRSGRVTITISNTGGYNGSVSLSVSGLPNGASASFSPSAVTAPGTSTMTIQTGRNTTRGTFQLTVTGTSGTLVHTTNVQLTVS